MGHAVAQLAEVLHYKPKGRGFDSRRGNWDFSWTSSFRPHYGPGAIQPLKEMGWRMGGWVS